MNESGEEKIKILVVDDEEGVRIVLRRSLEREGYMVFEAENGGIALEVIGRDAPDLVISDLNMPVMDGWALLAAVRAAEATRRLRVIILTGNTGAGTEGLDRGADDFIMKPFAIANVVARVKGHLKKLRV